MKIYTTIILFIIGFLITSWFGCSDENDNQKPSIEIIEPYENSSFLSDDSIYIVLEVFDETQLTSIEVVLTNEDRIPVGDLESFIPTSNTQKLQFYYHFNHQLLAEGDYYIRIKASDGTNDKFKYRKIHISLVPKELKKVLIVNRTTMYDYKVNYIDSSNQIIPIMAFNDTYSDGEVSSLHQQLYVTGKGHGECYAIDMNNQNLNWNLPEGGTPFTLYHERLFEYNHNFYLGLTEGYVKGYNIHGTQQFLATMSDARIPGVMNVIDDTYLIVAEKEKSGIDTYVSLYFLSGGAKWIEMNLGGNIEVVDIIPIDADNVFLFTNKGSDCDVLIFNISANTVHQPFILPAGSLYNVRLVNENLVLINHTNGIYLYDGGTSLQTFKSGVFRFMEFDPITQRIFTGDSWNFYVYQYPSGTEITNIPLSLALVDIILLYNR